uniref:Uncharacterized protein n=1 Tax=Clytia hemisphaerica TaxID=252671 RepID=A0A7M5V7Z3_9CNID
MEESEFRRYQFFLFFLCQTPHAALVTFRVISGPTDVLKTLVTLTEIQWDFLALGEESLVCLYIKMGVYALSFLSVLMCCCCCSRPGFYAQRFLYFVDWVSGTVLLVFLLIHDIKYGNHHSYKKIGNVFYFEIGFLVALAIMLIIDMFAMAVYTRGLKEGYYMCGETPNEAPYRRQQYEYRRLNQPPSAPPSYQTFGAPPPYQPVQRHVTRTDAPRNIQVAGLQESNCILDDGEGGIIFVRQLTGASLTASHGNRGNIRGVEQTQIAWITREAILRNPFNPEVRILTATEISEIDFGNERESIRNALRY